MSVDSKRRLTLALTTGRTSCSKRPPHYTKWWHRLQLGSSNGAVLPPSRLKRARNLFNSTAPITSLVPTLMITLSPGRARLRVGKGARGYSFAVLFMHLLNTASHIRSPLHSSGNIEFNEYRVLLPQDPTTRLGQCGSTTSPLSLIRYVCSTRAPSEI